MKRYILLIAALGLTALSVFITPVKAEKSFLLGQAKNPIAEKQAAEEKAVKRTMANFPKLLKKGMCGLAARTLNEMLFEMGYLDTDENEYFTENTENAVKAFQRENGLLADGIVGENTLMLLFERG
ncbi:MAG: peptidoglycan-binding protein [Christensenellaceae bacterium]|nr:peptidoglycan-binding protein [Christensenellaceae bacterium]